MKTVVRLVAGAGVAGMGLVGANYAGLGGEDNTIRDDQGAVVEAGELGAFRIRLGDCLADAPDGDFESVEAVPCSQPHSREVYAAFMLPGGSDAAYPGEQVVGDSADQGCYDRFEAFVGHDFETSIYGFGTITPTELSWQELDDREVLCILGNYDESLMTGSANGSGL